MTQSDDAHDASCEAPADRWVRVRPIVEALLAVPIHDRTAMLDEQCGGDARLRYDVVQMVQACEAAGAAGDFLAGPAAAAAALVADMQIHADSEGEAPSAHAVACDVSSPGASGDFTGGERFTLIRQLGDGGMGVVFEAIDRQTGARVALKMLPSADPHRLFEFKREFRSLAAFVHPNLIAPYELVADGDRWFFTMELVDGEDFLTWVRSDRPLREHSLVFPPALESIVDEQRLRHAAAQLATGVAALHTNGILHRDLKPPNILVRQDGRVGILDFGISVALGDTPSAGEHAGTLRYMSPEQLTGDVLTRASDWYAVGIILYEALTGRPPFEGPPAQMFFAKTTGSVAPPSTVVDGVPQDLDALCVELLRADASLRPSGEDIVARLTSDRSPPGVLETNIRQHGIFVGRQAQLATLASALEATIRGVSAAIYVHGESGTGKSALIEQFLVEARQREHSVILHGRCDEQESVPFKAVDAVMDALTGWLRTQSPRQLERLLPSDVGLLGRLFPVLKRIDAIADAPYGSLTADEPRELRRRAFSALRDLLARIGEAATLLVVIDDLQWGDADSAELLAHVLAGPIPPPLVFVATFRTEYRNTSRCLQVLLTEHADTHVGEEPVFLALPPLNAPEAQALARALLSSRVEESMVARVASESGGNPFFLHELARYARVHPHWVDDSTDRPVDLNRALWSRIETLPADARTLLEIVAVAGRSLRNQDWRDASDQAGRDPHAMSLLRYEHLVRSTGSSPDDVVEAYHDRIRETVVARLDPQVRRGHHRRLAIALATRGNADEETVAVHFAEGGEIERAGVHYARAADGAQRALAFDRAATLYERALESRPGNRSERRDLLSSLGSALANAGRGKLAGQAFERAASLADADDRLELQRMAATQYVTGGHIDEGRTLFMHVLRGVGLGSPLGWRARLRLRGFHFVEHAETDVPPRLLRRLDALRAVANALAAVDVVRVAGFQSQALLLALEAGEPHRLALALGWEAVLTATRGAGSASRTRDLLQMARRLVARVESPHARAMMEVAEGWVAFLHGRFPDAIDACARAEPIFRNECTGAWWELSTTRTMMTWAMTHCGDNIELGARLRAWYPEARARGDHLTVTNLLSFPLPYERLVGDDPAGAERFLEEAMDLWPYHGFHIQHVSVLYSRALMLLYRGDGAAACAEVTRCWPIMVRSLQTQNQVTRVLLRDVRARGALSAAAAGLDRERHMARAARDARAIAGERSVWAAGNVSRLQAGLAVLRGDEKSAEHSFKIAAAALDDSGLALQAAVARRQRGLLIGGGEGYRDVSAADAFMRARDVVNVESMSRMLGSGVA